MFFGRCDVCFVPLGHDNGSLVSRVLGGEVRFLNKKNLSNEGPEANFGVFTHLVQVVKGHEDRKLEILGTG